MRNRVGSTSRLWCVVSLLVCVWLSGVPAQSNKNAALPAAAQKTGPGATVVKVDTEGIENAPAGAEVLAALDKLPFVIKGKFRDDEWHLRLRPRAGEPGIRVERNGVGRIKNIPLGTAARDVAECARREAAWQAIKNLENTNPNSKVQIELRVVSVRPVRNAEGLVTEVADIKSSEFWSGGYFQFEVRNVGSAAAYLTIVNLSPIGEIKPMFPLPALPQVETKIPADKKWHRVPEPYVYEIVPPFGLEYFKVIATAENVGLVEIFQSGLPLRKGRVPADALGQYFATLPESVGRTDIEGDWDTATLTFKSTPSGEPERKTLHVLSVGVSRYSRAGESAAATGLVDLNTRNDVEDFPAALRKYGKGPFDDVSVTLLYDQGATKGAIISSFQRIIAKANPQDALVFQFSGHTFIEQAGQQLYFVPFDYDGKDPAGSSLSSMELQTLLGQIQAQHQFAVLDTKSSTRGFDHLISRLESESKELEGLVKRDLWIFGTADASRAYELLDEGTGKRYGLLTLSLMKGLDGLADANRDGLVSVKELTDYSQRFVAARQPYQRQQLWKFGNDFVLARSRGKEAGRNAEIGPHRFVPSSFAPWAQQDSQTDGQGEKQQVRAEIVGGGAGRLVRERNGKDYALLIATDDYKVWDDLSNPVRDAETIANDLQRIYGFEIDPQTDVLKNPTKKQILDALRRIKARQYQPDDQLFIFFAGHGHFNESLKEGYLIAADSLKPDEDEFGESYLPHSRLRTILDSIECRHILLVIDACFSGTFDEEVARRGNEPEYEERTNMEFIWEIMQHKTRRYMTSGGKVYTPDGRPGYHSPFASKLIDALRGYGGKYGVLTVNAILAHVERARPSPYHGRFGSDQPGSDFVFIVVKKDK
ncbi:MAG TPA: caspase family protein [Pyrinomonadaceae bacterium]|nr:caspase family protein [Pyrinomonadaceae bacterium]